jgi:hypothetical protein
MTALETVWAYIKKYWSLVALIGGAIITFFLFRDREVSFADEFKKINDFHNEELRKIQAARAEEQRQHAENQRKLEETLALVQQQYDNAKKDLDAKKKAQVEDLVKKYKDDPDALTKKLSEATGFKIVMPD